MTLTNEEILICFYIYLCYVVLGLITMDSITHYDIKSSNALRGKDNNSK